ncbi:Mitochondrial processing peptidase-like protein [hydrothermal vent metagenome]|uniref:Mitochondrial processing peptidase-like protein n=1 Tax=hydrothermal vent metagenome TaxID=652676 RepID=A0A3B0THW4_9ZZZZ
MSVSSTKLENGMTVLSHHMPHLESASMGVWVKAGSRWERPEENGISHFLEHMAFKGTKTRTSRQVVEQIEMVGGDLNAATSIEHTGYFARILKDDVPLATDILSDILCNSVFNPKDLAREQHVIEQEIGASLDDPNDQVFDLFQKAVFPDQAIGRPILGTVKSVKSFGPDQLRAYMDRNYVGNRMVVSAAGNVEHNRLVDMVSKRFAHLKPDGDMEPVAAKYIGGDMRKKTDNEQAQIIIGLEGRPYNSDGFYASQILASILGGGMSSRLFQEVREKSGLCYSIYAFNWSFADSGVFGVSASTGEEDVGELVHVILDELRNAVQNISEDEVLRVRNQIRAGLLMSLESPTSRAGQLARQQILWGRPIEMSETIERINKIDVNRVKEIAGQLFSSKNLSIAANGPIAQLPSLAELVEYFTK